MMSNHSSCTTTTAVADSNHSSHSSNNSTSRLPPLIQPQHTTTTITPDLEELRSVQIDNEIFEIPRRYRLIELRGQGSYGVVCSARDVKYTNSKQLVAIKKNRNVFPRTIPPQQPSSSSHKGSSQELDHHLPKIKHESSSNKSSTTAAQQQQKKLPHRSKLSQKRILRELKILSHLRSHPNIVQLHDVIEPRSYDAFGDVYFVTDLMEADLRDILESNQALTDQHVQYFMYQLLLAVHYSQSANILHRDLKPENILLNSNCELKICDFGLARGIDFECNPRMSTNYVQTRWYRAPELLLNNPTISKQTDMWSIGCILGELLGRRVLFKGSCPVDQMKKIINVLGTPADPEDIKGSEEGIKFVLELPYCRAKDFHTMFPEANSFAIDLLKQMLTFNHEKRITTEQALKHPYFKDLYDVRDIRTCDKVFDFSFEDHLDDDPDALKRCAYEAIMSFRKQVREEESKLRIQQQQQSPQPQSQPQSQPQPQHTQYPQQSQARTQPQPQQPQQPPPQPRQYQETALQKSAAADVEELRKQREHEQAMRKKLEEEERKRSLEEEKRKKKEEKRKKKESRSRFDIFRRAKNVFSL